jgi:hypothetical protein
MMINETIAKKESDAWMMRLARTMRRVQSGITFCGVVADFSTRIGGA